MINLFLDPLLIKQFQMLEHFGRICPQYICILKQNRFSKIASHTSPYPIGEGLAMLGMACILYD